MKKVLSLVLSLAMALSLAACGGSTAASTTAPASGAASEAAATEAAPAADGMVGVFYYTYSDTYIASVRTALDTALTDAGINYQDYDGNNSQTTQNEQIDTAIQQGATALVVNIVTSGAVDASQAIVDKAAAANIPVLFFNRAIEDDTTAGQVLKGSYANVAFVGTDAPEAGHMQGAMIGDYLNANYDAVDLNGDGVIQYAMMMGQLGNAEAIARTQFGVEDANAKLVEAGKPELQYFDAANTDCYQVDPDGAWSTAAANNYMTTNLSQYNEDSGNMIELVICNNDGMAEGVISALNDKGYNLGDGASKTIPVFGVDATDAAKQLIADGKMIGTIKQDAEGMASCIAVVAGNMASGTDMLAGTETYNTDPDISNKIYIPYATYTG